MKAMTYVGATDFPVDIRYVERGKMIDGANHGDQIISYYQEDGKNYASHFGTCSLVSGTVAKAIENHGLPLKTGFLPGEEVNYAVYRNGQYRKVIWGDFTVKSNGLKYYDAVLSDEVVDIKDNLYYSLDPVWPEKDQVITVWGEAPTLGTHHLWKFIQVQQYLPEFCQPSGNVFSLVEGSGRLRPAKNISLTTYNFTPDDIRRGSITLKITTTPLPNSGSKDISRVHKLVW